MRYCRDEILDEALGAVRHLRDHVINRTRAAADAAHYAEAAKGDVERVTLEWVLDALEDLRDRRVG